MSATLPFDPLLLLLDDPALLDALLAGGDPALAAAVLGPAVPGDDGAPPTGPGFDLMPEDAFPNVDALDAILADSYAPEPALDGATRSDLIDIFGLDPTLFDDVDALWAALAALEPPPEDDVPDVLNGEAAWDSSWSETVREDWAVG